jgi:Flp pilus assembly protein TadD
VHREAIGAVAYDQYLRGRYAWHRRSRVGLLAAVEHFSQATELAPRYARAWAGLADAYAVLGFYDFLEPAEAFPLAREAALRALATVVSN